MTQPDFPSLTFHLQGAITELIRVPNLPSVSSSQAILDRLDELQRGIADIKSELHNAVDQVKAQLFSLDDKLSAQIKASDWNNRARLYNSSIIHHENSFQSLRNDQNAFVDRFPDNSRSLAALQERTLTSLLEAFDLSVDGSAVIKRKRFRAFVGLVREV